MPPPASPAETARNALAEVFAEFLLQESTLRVETTVVEGIVGSLEQMNSLVATGQMTGSRRWVALAPLCVTLLVISLDTTVLNVALPSIVRDLHASSSQLQWVVDAYSLVFAGLLLSLGSLGDRVGRKWVFLSGLAVFAASSAGSAFAASPDRLVITRACMGIGAAAIMPSTLSI
jgi:predicted MFS family arabinose efflux permease